MPRSREELVEALRELATREWDPDCPATDSPTRVVTEAADLLDSLEEREEWWVVAVGSHLHGDFTSPSMPLAAAEAEARDMRRHYRHVRIQSRSTFATPWTDVKEGTDG